MKKEVSIYLPESMKSTQYSHDDIVQSTLISFVDLFGGASARVEKGYYRRQDGTGLDVENTTVVYAYTDSIERIGIVKGMACDYADEFKQETVLVVV